MKTPSRSPIIALAVMLLTSCANSSAEMPASMIQLSAPPVPAQREQTVFTPVPNLTQVGTASWYGPRFHGRMTASGTRFNQNAMTAAHRTLPLNTEVRVTNLANDKSVDVVINDRGPVSRRRIIDLSAAAADELELSDDGLGKVRIEVIKLPADKPIT